MRPLTVNAAWSRFLFDASAGIALARNGRPFRPASLEAYNSAIRHPALDNIRDQPLSEVRRGQVQAALDDAARTGISPSWRRNIATALRTLYRWGHARDLCDRHTLDGLELPAVDRPDRIALTPTAVRALLHELHDPTVAAAYATAAFTGARAQEIAALTWADIDLGARTIRLARDVRARKSRAAQRDVPIVAELAPFLEHARPTSPARGALSLIPGDRNPRQRAAWFRLRGTAALTGTPWADVRPHLLRHTWNSWLLEASVPLPAVRDLLGHESAASLGPWASGVTLDVYGHSVAGYVDRARATMDTWLDAS